MIFSFSTLMCWCSAVLRKTHSCISRSSSEPCAPLLVPLSWKQNDCQGRFHGGINLTPTVWAGPGTFSCLENAVKWCSLNKCPFFGLFKPRWPAWGWRILPPRGITWCEWTEWRRRRGGDAVTRTGGGNGSSTHSTEWSFDKTQVGKQEDIVTQAAKQQLDKKLHFANWIGFVFGRVRRGFVQSHSTKCRPHTWKKIVRLSKA